MQRRLSYLGQRLHLASPKRPEDSVFSTKLPLQSTTSCLCSQIRKVYPAGRWERRSPSVHSAVRLFCSVSVCNWCSPPRACPPSSFCRTCVRTPQWWARTADIGTGDTKTDPAAFHPHRRRSLPPRCCCRHAHLKHPVLSHGESGRWLPPGRVAPLGAVCISSPRSSRYRAPQIFAQPGPGSQPSSDTSPCQVDGGQRAGSCRSPQPGQSPQPGKLPPPPPAFRGRCPQPWGRRDGGRKTRPGEI